MNLFQRAGNILLGLAMIVCAIALVLDPETGLGVVALLISISLLCWGIGKILLYFTMARHMVGGKTLLWFGVIAFDIGVFAMALFDEPRVMVAIYLIVGYAVAGVVNVLRSLESKAHGAPWKLRSLHGVACVALALCAGFSIREPNVLTLIYCVSLVYFACVRIANAFRNTDIVHIA